MGVSLNLSVHLGASARVTHEEGQRRSFFISPPSLCDTCLSSFREKDLAVSFRFRLLSRAFLAANKLFTFAMYFLFHLSLELLGDAGEALHPIPPVL